MTTSVPRRTPADREIAAARGRQLVALAAEIDRVVSEAQAAVAGAAAAPAGHAAQSRLSALDLDAIKQVAEGNLRLGAIEAAGIRDVATLLTYDEHRLDTTVPGVGPQTATQVLAAARRLRDAVVAQVRVLPDAGAPDADGAALLAALHRFDHLWRQAAGAALHGREATARLQPNLRVLEAAPGRLKWAFASKATKVAVQAAADDVALVVDSPFGVAVTAELQAARASSSAYRPLDEATLWRDYESRGADYASALERADARFLGATGDQARGGLAGEIAERVEALSLDVRGMNVSLRSYQEFGAKYVVAQQRVVLGDEMGLGKTIQALAAMAHLRNVEGGRHFLVVSPASIIENWRREIAARSDFAAHVLHGDERTQVLDGWHASGGVAVTSYETLRTVSCPPDLRPALVVVDEAHYVKNPAAARSQSVAQWLAWCPRVMLMTGTAMENRLAELTHLVGLAQPAVASGLVAGKADLVSADPATFRERLSPVYLRRNQEDVLHELPDRIDVDEWVRLTPTDAAMYRDAVIAGEMMAMRQAATLGDHLHPSAKLERLAELLEAYEDEGRKVIVFSFFRRVLDEVVVLAGGGESITGDVAPAERLNVIDRFGAAPGFGVLALQIDAGGVGLNLQAASAVVLMEPQWKPSTEAQAIARAHRMGQTRKVVVHRLLARESVDESLMALLAQKQELFDTYARDSAIAGASDAAVGAELAEGALAPQVLAVERERLGITVPVPAPVTPATPAP